MPDDITPILVRTEYPKSDGKTPVVQLNSADSGVVPGAIEGNCGSKHSSCSEGGVSAQGCSAAVSAGICEGGTGGIIHLPPRQKVAFARDLRGSRGPDLSGVRLVGNLGGIIKVGRHLPVGMELGKGGSDPPFMGEVALDFFLISGGELG